MTNLLIHWAQLGENSIRVRVDFCCRRAAEAHEAGVLIDIPHYAIGLTNGMVIAYCPFCGAQVISINDITEEKTEYSPKEGLSEEETPDV